MSENKEKKIKNSELAKIMWRLAGLRDASQDLTALCVDVDKEVGLEGQWQRLRDCIVLGLIELSDHTDGTPGHDARGVAKITRSRVYWIDYNVKSEWSEDAETISSYWPEEWRPRERSWKDLAYPDGCHNTSDRARCSSFPGKQRENEK